MNTTSVIILWSGCGVLVLWIAGALILRRLGVIKELRWWLVVATALVAAGLTLFLLRLLLGIGPEQASSVVGGLTRA
jgi:hypothetical protein